MYPNTLEPQSNLDSYRDYGFSALKFNNMIKYSTLLIAFLFSANCFSQWTPFHEVTNDNFYKMALKNNQLFIGAEFANIYYQVADDEFEIASLQGYGFINEIQFINGQIGFVGSGCYFPTGECPANTIYKTIDGGLTWSLLAQFASFGVVNSITPITENKIFALTGHEGLYYTEDGGNTWTNTIIEEGVNGFDQLQFVNETVGFVVGYTYQVNLGYYHIIYKTTDGGQTWAQIYNTLDNGFNVWSCHFIDSNTGFFTSDNGKVFKTIDSGETWTPISFTNTTTISGRKIEFVTPNVGYLTSYDNVHQTGALYRTVNAGATWQLDLQIDSSLISEFVFSDINNGYAIVNYQSIYQRKGTTETTVEPLDVVLYPNPTTDYFKVQLTNLATESFQMNVLNASGQLIFSTQELYNSIPTTYWAAGIYFVEIQDKNGKLLQRGKLVKIEK